MNWRLIASLAAILACSGPTCSGTDWGDTEFERTLPTAYVPGRPMTVFLQAYAHDSFSFYAHVYEVIPPGWTVVDSFPDHTSFDEDTGTIFWNISIPAGVALWFVTLNYDVVPPPDAEDEVTFDGHAFYRYHVSEDRRFAETTGDASLSRGAETVRTVPDEYATIQEAMDVSEFGDAIVVRPGLYVENVRMQQGVDIRGEGYPPPELRAKSTLFNDTAIRGAPHCSVRGLLISSAWKGISCPYRGFEVRNCIITGTERGAIDYGGVVPGGRATNCTITDNGGDGVHCSNRSPRVVVSNCILFGNAGEDVIMCTARSCLLEDDIRVGWGQDNIYADPMFVNSAQGDYRLLPGSPCIDAGDNSVVGADEVDLAGNLRIMFGGKEIRVDMGAYEYQARTPALSPLSNDLRLIWSSDPGKTYSVFYSFDLTTWQLADDNVPSAGATTLWSDPIGWPPPIPTRFYRIVENE